MHKYTHILCALPKTRKKYAVLAALASFPRTLPEVPSRNLTEGEGIWLEQIPRGSS